MAHINEAIKHLQRQIDDAYQDTMKRIRREQDHCRRYETEQWRDFELAVKSLERLKASLIADEVHLRNLETNPMLLVNRADV